VADRATRHAPVPARTGIAFPILGDRTGHGAGPLAGRGVCAGKGGQNVAVIQNGVIDPVLFDHVIKGLDDQMRFDSIACHLAQVHREKVQSTQGWKLIQKQ
jgi:hypothetical protein